MTSALAADIGHGGSKSAFDAILDHDTSPGSLGPFLDCDLDICPVDYPFVKGDRVSMAASAEARVLLRPQAGRVRWPLAAAITE